MGVAMLLALGLLTVLTGLPIWSLLVGVSSLFAALALGAGVAQWEHLGAVTARVLGVLDNDLLQALPLYVFVGVLLQQLPIGQSLLAVFQRLAWRTGAGEALAALGTGALLAPMNGSVAASSALLSRLLGPQLQHLAPSRAMALVATAATIGVVVPPSLVLLLLGDAMMQAHTQASHWSGWVVAVSHIVNTQDVMHAALLPALAIWLSWLAWGLVGYRRRGVVRPACTPRQWGVALLTILVVLGLLSGVFVGYFFAVEAAAAGALLLVAYALLGRVLNATQWRAVLADSLALSGALLSLLVGATVFSMVLRLWGTDVRISEALLHSGLAPAVAAAAILLALALCAWVLDAFEMIFVVVPVLAPPFVYLLQDAQQAAVLLLLVLQLSFLLPPLGYAVMIARAHQAQPVGSVALVRALAPFLLVQVLAIGVVFAFPQVVHGMDPPRDETAPLSDEEVTRMMMEQAAPDAPEAAPTPQGASRP